MYKCGNNHICRKYVMYLVAIHNRLTILSEELGQGRIFNLLLLSITPQWLLNSYILKGCGATAMCSISILRVTLPVTVGPNFLEDWFIPWEEFLFVGDVEEVHLQVRHDRWVLPLFVHVTAITDDKFLRKDNTLRSGQQFYISGQYIVWWMIYYYTAF